MNIHFIDHHRTNMENYFPLQEEEEEEGEKSSYVHIKHRIKDWIWECQIRICSRTTGATYVAQIHAPSPHLPNKCYSPLIDDDESSVSWALLVISRTRCMIKWVYYFLFLFS